MSREEKIIDIFINRGMFSDLVEMIKDSNASDKHIMMQLFVNLERIKDECKLEELKEYFGEYE